MGVVINQYEVFLVELEPAKGHKIKKTRPCLIISPNEMNHYIQTIIIAPMTTKGHGYPSRVELNFINKKGWIVLDQIRTIDKTRLIKKIGIIDKKEIFLVKKIIKEMLID